MTKLRVFPNPSDGVLSVNYWAQQAEPVQIRVVDGNGRIVQTQQEQATAGDNMFRVDMSSRGIGWYLIQLQSPNGLNTRKVLIQR